MKKFKDLSRGILGVISGVLFILLAPLPWTHCFFANFSFPWPFVLPGLHWICYPFAQLHAFTVLIPGVFAVYVLVDLLVARHRHRLIIWAVTTIVLIVAANLFMPWYGSQREQQEAERKEVADQAWWSVEIGTNRTDTLAAIGHPNEYEPPFPNATFFQNTNSESDFVFMTEEEFAYATLLATASGESRYLKQKYLEGQGHVIPKSGWLLEHEWIEDVAPFFERTQGEDILFDQCDGYNTVWEGKVMLCYEQDTLVLKAGHFSMSKDTRVLGARDVVFDLDRDISLSR